MFTSLRDSPLNIWNFEVFDFLLWRHWIIQTNWLMILYFRTKLILLYLKFVLKGRCISDPSLCANGVTMIFWARIEQAALLTDQQLPKYVLSSGGSDHRSRGFSFFHQNYQFVLRVSAAEKEWRIEIPQGQIPLNSWFSFAFTWKNGTFLKSKPF